MGAILLAGGDEGKRCISTHSRVLLHQPLINTEFQGPTTNLNIETNEILRLQKLIYDILSKHTGQNPSTIEKDCDRDCFLDAESAIQYGLADKISDHLIKL